MPWQRNIHSRAEGVKQRRRYATPALKPEHIAVLHDIVAERVQANSKEIADELHHRCGLRACAAAIRVALRAHGFVRLKPLRRCARHGAPSITATRQPTDVRTYLLQHRPNRRRTGDGL